MTSTSEPSATSNDHTVTTPAPSSPSERTRGARSESPTWQRIESIGQTYFRMSRRLAHFVAATRQRKP